MLRRRAIAGRPAKGIRESRGDQVFNIINSAVLLLLLAAVLYPLIFVVSASVSNGDALLSGRVRFLPVGFSLFAYQRVFNYPGLWTAYANTIYYTVVGTAVNVAMTLLAAYPLSRRDLPGKGLILGLFVFTMFFSGGLIPTYLLVRDLKMLDTRWALIIPSALSAWLLMITVTYFRISIPAEMLEASQLDGCSDIQYMMHILLPLSTPVIAVLSLFYAVGHWNEFFAALIYLNNKDLFPLQIILRNILVQSQVDLKMTSDLASLAQRQALAELLRYALIVVATAPVLAIYPFAQKYFVRGAMLGAVKG